MSSFGCVETVLVILIMSLVHDEGYEIKVGLSWDVTQYRLVAGLPAGRGNLLVPSSRVKQSKKIARFSRNVGKRSALLNILEERRLLQIHCGSLQYRISKLHIAR